MNVTDEMVERAAQVFYDSQPGTHGRLATPGYADHWRAVARRALEAAAVPEASDDERYEDSENYAETLEWLIDLGVEKVAAKMSLDGIIRRVRRGPVPAGTPSEDGVWTCGHCGHGSAAHGTENHEAYKCIYEPVWNPAARSTPCGDERDRLTLIARDVHLYDGGENAAITGPHARRIADAILADRHPTPPEDVAALVAEATGWIASYRDLGHVDTWDRMTRLVAALAAVPADGETEWERWFRAGWEESGEGYNGEYPDEGVPWHKSAGRKAYLRLARSIPEGSAD